MNNYSISFRQAAMLLLDRGRVSLQEIEMLPSVKNREQAIEVVRELKERFQDSDTVCPSNLCLSSEYEDDKIFVSISSGLGDQDTSSSSGDESNRQPVSENLAESIRKRFSPFGGVELEIPPR